MLAQPTLPPSQLTSFDSFNTLAALSAIGNVNIDKLPGVNKRVYYCQRCLNHGRLEPRKNHKCECLYAQCACSKCILVEKRRVLNTQLHELEESESKEKKEVKMEEHDDDEEERPSGLPRIKGGPFYPSLPSRPFELSLSALKHVLEPEGVSYTKRVPNCQKCGQHGRKSRLKGHKRVCPYRECNCPKCQVVSERQKLMADQIKIRRRQRKDTLMNLTKENLTATLTAAAAFSAAANGHNIPFGIGDINSFLMSQLKCTPSLSSTTSSSSFTPPSPRPSDTSNPLLPPSTSSSQSVYPFSMDLLKQSPFLFPSSPTVSSPSSFSLSSALDSVLNATKSTTVGSGSPVTSSTTPSPTLSLPVSSPPIVAPIPINPTLPSPPPSLNFPFPLLPNDVLLQSLLANYKGLFDQSKLVEESSESPSTPSNAIIDVCSV